MSDGTGGGGGGAATKRVDAPRNINQPYITYINIDNISHLSNVIRVSQWVFPHGKRALQPENIKRMLYDYYGSSSEGALPAETGDGVIQVQRQGERRARRHGRRGGGHAAVLDVQHAPGRARAAAPQDADRPARAPLRRRPLRRGAHPPHTAPPSTRTTHHDCRQQRGDNENVAKNGVHGCAPRPTDSGARAGRERETPCSDITPYQRT